MLMKTKVALLQLKIKKDKKLNIKNSINKIRYAAKKGAKIICTSELFLSEYFCKVENHSYFKYAEKIPGVTSELFCKLAKELKIILIVSLFEKKIPGLYYNTCITINEDGKILSKYRKMHIPDDPGYYEKFYFTPGDLGFKSIKTKYGEIGTLICWDQWFPEAARLTSLKGSEIIFYPTAIGWHPKEKSKYGKTQLESWITIQKSHAIANGIFVAAINRVGCEKRGSRKIEFWGHSFVIDPNGKIIAKLKSKKEGILFCDIDFKRVDNARQHWPFLRDRRIDAYNGLIKNLKND
ncbi:MAG: carbon-nitrogen hydrolase [Candidatus Pelagibacter sp. TMED118]|nr:MAG: carbon-nitrogen hydrolase [Candidatus Pelagibacter sp. TMED118]